MFQSFGSDQLNWIIQAQLGNIKVHLEQSLTMVPCGNKKMKYFEVEDEG